MSKDLAKIETNPASFIEQAIKSNLGVEHLEKLMDLQERWESTQARKLFLDAMVNFQSTCPPLTKTKQVKYQQVNYKYAPLGEISETIKNSLKENGLSYRWEMKDDADNIHCTFIISHISGHSERTTMSAKKDNSGSKNEIQARGSTITYLQRYTLIAGLGITTADEDNGGRNVNQYEGVKVEQPKKTEVKQPEKSRNYTAEVNECKTLDELRDWYLSLTKDEQKKYQALKNNRKEEIEREITEIEVKSGDIDVRSVINSLTAKDFKNEKSLSAVENLIDKSDKDTKGVLIQLINKKALELGVDYKYQGLPF